MKMLELWIRNINTHTNTHIVLEEGITALMGNTGAGKTTVLSIPYAVAYGKLPPYEGTIIDRVTLGYTGDAYVAMKFEMEGIEYLAERKIRKTAKTTNQECILTDLTNNAPVAGPKVEPFETAIINLIGSEEIFSASVFQAQKEYINKPKDLVNCKPTARKEILCEILDTSHLQEKADKFADKLKKVNSDLSMFDIQKQQLEGLIEVIDEKESDILKIEIKLDTEKVENIQKELNALNIKKDSIEADNKRIDELIQKKKEIENKGLNVASQIKFEQDGIENLTLLSGKVKELAEYQQKRQKIIQENTQLIDINKDIQKVKDENNSTKIKYQKEISEIKEFNQEIDNQVRAIEREVELDASKKESKYKELKRKTEILETADFTGIRCKGCDFIKDSLDAQKELESMTGFNEKGDYICYTEEIVKKIKELELSIKPLLTEPIYQKEDDLIPLNAVPDDKSTLLSQANNAQSKIDEANRNILRLREEREVYAKEYKEIIVTEKSDILDISSKIDNLNNLISFNSSKVMNNQNSLSFIEERKRKNEELSKKIENLYISNSENIKNQKIYIYLQRAFGKNGIQALLIDSALPHIETLSNEILSIARTGCWLEWSTEKENKDGTTREGMEIIYTDEKGSRDIGETSGGENELLRFIIRVAISIYQSQRAKIKLQTMLMDESTGGMSEEYREGWKRSLIKAGEYFNRFIIVSHNEELLSEIENKIFFKNGSVK